MSSSANSNKKFTLLIPAAVDKPAYKNQIPHIFTPDKEGILICLKSILGLNLDNFDDIYFTILRKHAEKYDIDTLLRLQLKRLGLEKAKIVILDNPTSTQAETIAKTIRQENIEGPIFIKDADSYFAAEILPENGVVVYPLEKLELVDPRNKSYVAVDDMQHVTNIIEKRIVSNLFNAGGYCFGNAEDFLEAYDRHKALGSIYLSHLIYSMLLNGHLFRPIRALDYSDWNIKR